MLFIAIAEASNDAVITETINGIIISWKPSAERLFGLAMQEAIGDIIIPDERRPEIYAFWTGPPRGHKIHDYEAERVSKKGNQLGRSHKVLCAKSASGATNGPEMVAAHNRLRDGCKSEKLSHSAAKRDIRFGSSTDAEFIA